MSESVVHLLIPGVLTTAILAASVAAFKVWFLQQKPSLFQSPFPRGKLCDLRDKEDGEVRKLSDLPDGWWTSSEVFDNEKRAIFAQVRSCGYEIVERLMWFKMPVAVAHASMFLTPGSYRVIEHPGGFPLFLILGKDYVLRCFHNVCRHRAYPVVSTKRVGCTPILGCKYHGWTYDLKGNLVKAPKFDSCDGFRKEQNSLFEVHCEIDDKGVVYVDLTTKPGRNTSVDVKKFSQGRVESWEAEAEFNWKVAGRDASGDGLLLSTWLTWSP